MNAVTYFAGELSRLRPLTEDECTRLDRALRISRNGVRKLWTAANDRELARLRRKHMTAEQIAEAMNRTPWSVRSRIRALNRKEKRGG